MRHSRDPADTNLLSRALMVINKRLVHFRIADALTAFILVVLATAARFVLLEYRSLDFYASLRPWYNTIKSEGFSAFAAGFSTYNPPYLYLLYLVARFLPDLSVVVAVKLPSLIADFVCAGVVGLIVRRQSPNRGSLHGAPAALLVLFAPTVILNSSFWGQADSLFTAGLLGCIHFLGIRRHGWSMFAFGVALAFKLQAIFLAPLLLALVLRGDLPLKPLLWIPGTLLAAILPSVGAGRPLGELLGIYGYQASQFEFITMNAPSIYAWLPQTKRVFNLMVLPGVAMGLGVALLWTIILVKGRQAVKGRLLVEVALVTLLLVPLFLPKMHERYFFPADLLSIAVAFLYPRLYFVPVLVIGTSFAAYQPFLFERDLLALPILAIVLLGTTAVLTYHAVKQLFGMSGQSADADALGGTG